MVEQQDKRGPKRNQQKSREDGGREDLTSRTAQISWRNQNKVFKFDHKTGAHYIRARNYSTFDISKHLAGTGKDDLVYDWPRTNGLSEQVTAFREKNSKALCLSWTWKREGSFEHSVEFWQAKEGKRQEFQKDQRVYSRRTLEWKFCRQRVFLFQE